MGAKANRRNIFVSIVNVVIPTVLTVIVYEMFKTTGSWIATSVAVSQDTAYRQLAEDTLAVQRGLVEQQKVIEELAALRSRVGAIENLLREVG